MSEKPDEEKGADIYCWAANTAGYWKRSLEIQENEKGMAMVMINQEDIDMLMTISSMGFEISWYFGRLEAEKREAEASAKQPAQKRGKILQKILRRTNAGKQPAD